MNAASAQQSLTKIVDTFPPALRDGQRGEVPRFAFQLALLASECPAAARIADIGGGWGTFALGAAAAGMKATLVDDFRDPGFVEPVMNAMRAVYEQHAIDIVSADVLAPAFRLQGGPFDAITCFDAMEHWHASPKEFFRSLLASLRPGGLFLIGTPNCVNLRKRITVPLGRGKWSAMSDWYEQPVFRGHVREPDVDDLRYIAGDLGLEKVRVIGRNWAGYAADGRAAALRPLMPLIDRLLRLRPTLCSDLYLLGRRPAGAS